MSPCTNCGSKNGIVLYHLALGTYVKCKNCTLVAIDPLPKFEDMITRSEYWAENHHKRSDKVEQHFSEKFQEVIYKNHLDEMKPYKLNGRVLDIGCGIGSFVHAAEKRGWDAYGIDIGPAISIAQDHDLKVFQDRLEDISFPENHFDVITMFDVIEHIVDLDGLIKQLRKNLRDGGLLIIKTPNINCLTSRLLRYNWSALQPLDHLTLFSPETIKSYLTNNGFDPISVRTEDINIFELIGTIRKTYSKNGSNKTRNSNRKLIKRIVNNKLLQIGRSLINFVLNLFNLGESLIVYAENVYLDLNPSSRVK